MAKSTMYLYNIDPHVLADMPYKQALEHKIEAAGILISELLIPHYTVRDYVRVADVLNAIKFNKALLSELKVPN